MLRFYINNFLGSGQRKREIIMQSSVSRDLILKRGYEFFLDLFQSKAKSYKNKKFNSFKINPFTIQATSLAFAIESDAESIAKAVVYPFALGTSMATSFGTKTQDFIVKMLGKNVMPSTENGMDIKYIDCEDGRQKYCQLKAGPSTINKDDIATIENHFKHLRNLARTNHLHLEVEDSVIGVLYGDHEVLSTMYKTLEKDGFTVLAGEEFWYHLTGYRGLYAELIEQARLAANESGMMDSMKYLINDVEKHVKQNLNYFGLDD